MGKNRAWLFADPQSWVEREGVRYTNEKIHKIGQWWTQLSEETERKLNLNSDGSSVLHKRGSASIVRKIRGITKTEHFEKPCHLWPSV